MANPDSMPKVLVIAGHRQLHPTRGGHCRARCECGWISGNDLDSVSKRREAHRMHKEDIWKAQQA